MIQASPSAPAVLLIGHGTRLAAGVAEFQCLVERLRHALPLRTLLAGFLELTEPSLAEALETLRQRGFRRIIALPVFLMAAGHIKNDIPISRPQTFEEHLRGIDYDRKITKQSASSSDHR